MMQTPVNYSTTQVPMGYQPSYNAVKIDIHNPKVMDNPQCCNSPYGMPMVPYYNYPMAQVPYQYPYMPLPQPVPVQPAQTEAPKEAPVSVPQQVQQPQQPTVQQVVPVVPQPVPVVPVTVPQTPVQQVVNNGVPTQQTVQQNVPQQPVQQPQQSTQPAQPQNVQPQQPTTVAPEQNMPVNDITPVLKGLKSNNLAEQSDALNKIGYAANDPNEIKKYLETSVLDSLLGILNTDISGLATATPAQIDARTKWVNEKPMTEEEKTLAQTYAPQEFAMLNKQNALYSIAVLQKALADELENKTGEKLSIEKLPAIDQVVNVVKSNPSPELRGSAIVALAHLNKPEYKPVLKEIFELAEKDQDPNVKQVATEALKKINE